jgi:hypothetical protein
MRDVIQCYADIVYFKGTMHLPPSRVATRSEQDVERMPQPAASGDAARRGIATAARAFSALLRQHLDRHATAAVFAGKRSLRRIGG